jgi:hypothetical protein
MAKQQRSKVPQFDVLTWAKLPYELRIMAACCWRATRRRHCLDMGLGLLLAVVDARAANDAPTAPVGQPSTTPAQAPQAAVTGGEVDPDDLRSDQTQWSTTDSTRSIQLGEATTVTLGPNSSVLKQPKVPVSLGIKDAAPRTFCLELVSGTLDVEVATNRRPFHGVLVHAPRRVGAIVKVGRATISATTAGTTVAARSGQDMTVSVSERWRALRVGRSFSVTAADPAGSQRQLLAAPTVQVDRPVVLAFGSDPPSQRLSWRAIRGSQGYLLRIFRQSGHTSKLVREQRTQRSESVVDGLAPGRYSANVTTIDPTGLESGESPPIQLRIVEAGLPPGAYATPTAIHLPANERITLLHAEGLKMTYGAGNTMFVAAPETVGLHDGQSVQIRLRENGTSALETHLQLEPLDIRPRIWLEPRRAIWPGLPVSIRVSLQHDGTLPPEAAAMVASVSINAQPISVNWQHIAGTMTTQVDKPAFAGPWVVRVVVHDPRGHVMARDFLEVAQQPGDEIDRTSSL